MSLCRQAQPAARTERNDVCVRLTRLTIVAHPHMFLKPVAASVPASSCRSPLRSAAPRPAELALYSLTESARTPFHAEPTHWPSSSFTQPAAYDSVVAFAPPPTSGPFQYGSLIGERFLHFQLNRNRAWSIILICSGEPPCACPKNYSRNVLNVRPQRR